MKNLNRAVKIVQPSGILDKNKALQFQRQISDVVDEGANIVLVDFQDVTFMDSSGLGALVSALKTVRAANGKLAVCSINHQIRILFEIACVDTLIEIFASQDDFKSAEFLAK
ncbi:MAG: STAS domain-containing protein [Oscillatoria princeps RMCB-10]|jgi:anti-anti-sigma factor|nr:STAS domain-containing protein [Oscillatoria princeps RMCB-10]